VGGFRDSDVGNNKCFPKGESKRGELKRGWQLRSPEEPVLPSSASQLRHQAKEENWPGADIRKVRLSSAKGVKCGWEDIERT